MTSLTTELYGLLAVTIFLYTLQQHYNIKQNHKCKVAIYCDNQQAINMANEMEPPINISKTLVPEYDLQQLLHSIQQLLKLKKSIHGYKDIKMK